MSAHFSCYGETAIGTPQVDKLAADGVRLTHAFVTAPVCSSSPSAMITGMYQKTIGANHHRSGRGEHRITLPSEVVPLPAPFQKAGFFTCNGSGLPDLDFRSLPVKSQRLGETDYNFDWDPAIHQSWAAEGK